MEGFSVCHDGDTLLCSHMNRSYLKVPKASDTYIDVYTITVYMFNIDFRLSETHKAGSHHMWVNVVGK